MLENVPYGTNFARHACTKTWHRTHISHVCLCQWRNFSWFFALPMGGRLPKMQHPHSALCRLLILGRPTHQELNFLVRHWSDLQESHFVRDKHLHIVALWKTKLHPIEGSFKLHIHHNLQKQSPGRPSLWPEYPVYKVAFSQLVKKNGFDYHWWFAKHHPNTT